jgi:hypothetical protein
MTCDKEIGAWSNLTEISDYVSVAEMEPLSKLEIVRIWHVDQMFGRP